MDSDISPDLSAEDLASQETDFVEDKQTGDEGIVKYIEVEMDPESEDFELGMNLTRSRWDPYPWVAYVLEDGPAEKSGVRAGDVLLSIQDTDIVGLKISSIAEIVRAASGAKVKLKLWTNSRHGDCDPESLCCGPLPSGLTSSKAALTAILTALECPVCGGTWSSGSGKQGTQCSRGHLLCGYCRTAINNCPMCRTPFYSTKDPRSRNIFAESVYTSIIEAFRLDKTSDNIETHACLNRRIVGSATRRPKIPTVRIDGVSSCHDLTTTSSVSCENLTVNNHCQRCRHSISPQPKKKVTNKLLARLLTASANPWRAKSVEDLRTNEGVSPEISRSASASNVDGNSGLCACGTAIEKSEQSSTNGIAGSSMSLTQK